MIFHDPLLDRMTAASGVFETRAAEELKGLALGASGERVPAFEELLGLWPEGLPLLCEMKVDGTTDPAAFAQQVAARLARSMDRWRKFDPARQASMRAALEEVARGARSADVLEVVSKALA
jgi:glycerophosphoryl diester phosphodiesterase